MNDNVCSSLLAWSVLAVVASATTVPAQIPEWCGLDAVVPQDQWIRITGKAQYGDDVKGAPPKTRVIDYVVWHRTGAASFRAYVVEHGDSRQKAEGIELIDGAAYMKITDQPTAVTPRTAALAAATHPVLYREALRRALRAVVRTGDVDEVVRLLVDALAEAGEGVRSELAAADAAGLRREFDSSHLEDAAVLVRALKSDDRAREAMVIVQALAKLGVLQDLLVHIRFPFILSHRTAGGAEGTEVVTWAYPDPEGEERRHVWYFYVGSDHQDPKDIAIGGFWWDKPEEAVFLGFVPIGYYMHVELIMKEQDQWCAVKLTTGRIEDLAPEEREIVTQAVIHAERAGIRTGKQGGAAETPQERTGGPGQRAHDAPVRLVPVPIEDGGGPGSPAHEGDPTPVPSAARG